MFDPIETAIGRLRLPNAAALAFRKALDPPHRLRAGQRLAPAASALSDLHLVLAGTLKASFTLGGGGAQTLGLFLPGDIIGLDSAAIHRQLVDVDAASSSVVARLPGARLKRLLSEHLEIGEGLWRAAAYQMAILQVWTVGLGRRTARAQLAHLLCEFAHRLQDSREADAVRYDFPLTQAQLADALGLSPVHVNRVLQSLRADGLVQLTHGDLRILDGVRLAAVAEFDPAYLGSGDAACRATTSIS